VPAAAALRQLVALLGAHELDLKDVVLGLCHRRHGASHTRELPPHPEGPLGTRINVQRIISSKKQQQKRLRHVF